MIAFENAIVIAGSRSRSPGNTPDRGSEYDRRGSRSGKSPTTLEIEIALEIEIEIEIALEIEIEIESESEIEIALEIEIEIEIESESEIEIEIALALALGIEIALEIEIHDGSIVADRRRGRDRACDRAKSCSVPASSYPKP